MSAREHLFWVTGGAVLMFALLGLAICGWFFGMPARELFVFIAWVAMLPLMDSIHTHWKGWQHYRSK